MENKKVTPITRINKWFSEEDFKLEIDLGREAIEGDGNFTLILASAKQALASLIRSSVIGMSWSVIMRSISTLVNASSVGKYLL